MWQSTYNCTEKSRDRWIANDLVNLKVTLHCTTYNYIIVLVLGQQKKMSITGYPSDLEPFYPLTNIKIGNFWWILCWRHDIFSFSNVYGRPTCKQKPVSSWVITDIHVVINITYWYKYVVNKCMKQHSETKDLVKVVIICAEKNKMSTYLTYFLLKKVAFNRHIFSLALITHAVIQIYTHKWLYQQGGK